MQFYQVPTIYTWKDYKKTLSLLMYELIRLLRDYDLLLIINGFSVIIVKVHVIVV